jgi:hypothetical protein
MSDRRAETINLLVDEAVRKAVDGGLIIGNELAFRARKRTQIEEHAERHPTYLQKQADRHFGATARASSMPTCPHCDLTFHPADQQAVRGRDDLLYCRQGCADRIPFATFAETCAMHPEWAASLAFAADAIARRGATTGLASIHPPLEPAGADLPF